MSPTAQPSLFDLEVEPDDDQPAEYRHDVLVGDCLHVIASLDPEADASTRDLAEWSHQQGCEGAT